MICPMITGNLFKTLANNYLSVVCNLHTSRIFRAKSKKCATKVCEPTPVAIILCGCGGLDGSESAEVISLAIHCSENNLLPRYFAPDVNICGVVNHLTREPETSTRNALVESARLARPTIKPLSECKACSHQALIIPGGFGAVRTLSDFMAKGADCTVLPELQTLMEEFNCEKKPFASVCIGSALLARVLKGVKVTLGRESPKEDWPYSEAIKHVKDMGAKVEMKDATGVSYCKLHNAYSNPALMYAHATYAEVHEGIGKMISMMAKSMSR